MPVKQPTIVYGEEGAIALTGPDEVSVANLGTSGELVSTESKTIQATPLPAHFKSGPDDFTWSLLNDQPFENMVSPQQARDTQEILDAGLRSMASGARISLPMATFVD